MRCNYLEYIYEIREREFLLFKKNKVLLGIYRKLDTHNLSDEIEINFSSDDVKIYNELKQIRLNIIQDFTKLISSTLNRTVSNISKELKVDFKGQIILIENDLNKLLQINQNKIIELDKNYLHQLLKISNYIKTKNENIQNIFKSINSANNPKEAEESIGLLKNHIYTYELLVFNSINMLGALIDRNLLIFYEIYESFEKLGIFTSTWEMDVANKLANIDVKLDELLLSISKMEANIVSEISRLSYISQSSFQDLKYSVSNQLKEIGSSINFNTLLTGIQAYQMYKINRNTK